jgi:serine/threonine-protein kinase
MLDAGAMVGRYTLEEELARGPFGRVYRAVDAEQGFRVALKIFAMEPGASEADRSAWAARILGEARAAAQVRLEHAVAVHEVGLTAAGHPYLVRDYIVGDSLAVHARDSRPETLPAKSRWLRDYARLLAQLHDAGVLHRSVSPDNAVVRRDGALRVLGFGIAHRSVDRAAGVSPPSSRFLDRAPPSSPFARMAGYLAPEQLGHRPVGPSADQFAWGVMAYEVLSGEPPWGHHDKAVRLVEAVLTREPPPLAAYRPWVPPAFDALLRRCLAKSEDQRFPSMHEVAAAVEGALTGVAQVGAAR